MTGESLAMIKNSPFIERLESDGYEVVMMSEAIDEYLMTNMTDYKEYKFVNITRENLNLNNNKSSEESKENPENNETTEDLENTDNVNTLNKEFFEKIKTILGNSVEKVVSGKRVTTSPCCLVSSEHGWSANMERLVKAQALGDYKKQSFMKSQKILELNTDHEFIKSLQGSIENEQEFNDKVYMMYNLALMRSGYTIDNTKRFAELFYKYS